jgi:ABC-type anion transport system duplicated permease subunit
MDVDSTELHITTAPNHPCAVSYLQLVTCPVRLPSTPEGFQYVHALATLTIAITVTVCVDDTVSYSHRLADGVKDDVQIMIQTLSAFPRRLLYDMLV